MAGACEAWPPDDNSVVEQVVIYATGNVPLIADIPGLAAVYHFNGAGVGDQGSVSWFRTFRTSGLEPKRGGTM